MRLPKALAEERDALIVRLGRDHTVSEIVAIIRASPRPRKYTGYDTVRRALNRAGVPLMQRRKKQRMDADPTPEQIAERCAVIRAERLARRRLADEPRAVHPQPHIYRFAGRTRTRAA